MVLHLQAQRRSAAKTVRASTSEDLLNGDQAGHSAEKNKGEMISHTQDTITCKKKRIKLMRKFPLMPLITIS